MRVPLRDLITCQRTHSQIPPHWWLIIQHLYCGGRHKQSVLCKFEVIFLCSFDLHFFMSLSAICVSSLEIRPFKPFEIQLFACCCWGVRVIFFLMFWILIPYQMYDLRTFSSILWFNFGEVKLFSFCSCFCFHSQETHCQIQWCEYFPLLF